MFERFSRPARTMVEGAVMAAHSAGDKDVRPEHLFVALLGEADGLAGRVLSDLGAPVDRILEELAARRGRYVDGLGEEDAEALATIGIDLDEVLKRIGDEPGGRKARGRPRFSREAKKVLELSLREAIALQHNYIGTEHVLLGLVRGGDPLVIDTLSAVEVTPKGLRTAVADAVRKAG